LITIPIGYHHPVSINMHSIPRIGILKRSGLPLDSVRITNLSVGLRLRFGLPLLTMRSFSRIAVGRGVLGARIRGSSGGVVRSVCGVRDLFRSIGRFFGGVGFLCGCSGFFRSFSGPDRVNCCFCE
jgi:hypothetical protein